MKISIGDQEVSACTETIVDGIKNTGFAAVTGADETVDSGRRLPDELLETAKTCGFDFPDNRHRIYAVSIGN
jgi:hypothetical protein